MGYVTLAFPALIWHACLCHIANTDQIGLTVGSRVSFSADRWQISGCEILCISPKREVKLKSHPQKKIAKTPLENPNLLFTSE